MPASRLDVRVNLAERGYDIVIGSDTLSSAGENIKTWCQPSHVVVISDRNVEPLHAAPVVQSLVAAGLRVDQLVVEPG